MLKCLIVDDEQLARQLLESYVEKLPYLELSGSCCNAVEALSFLQNSTIDLVFLDIQMPDLLGTELLKSLVIKPIVIFTTAYQEYAVESYELDAIDYMLKPITFDRFIQGINKVQNSIGQRKNLSYQSNFQIEETKKFITLKTPNKIHRVKYENLIYIEGLREYLAFYTKTEKIIVLESFKNMENTLPEDVFLRVHRSYIINKEFVKSMEGNLLVLDNVKIPIGKSYKKVVVKKIFE